MKVYKPIHSIGWLLALCALVLAALACNLPGGAAPSPSTTQAPPDAIYTAAAHTLAAQLTEGAASAATAVPPTQPAGEAPSETPTAPAAAETSTPTPTDTLAPSATLSVPIISASENTNCRLGPSKLYDPPVGTLLKSQTSEVVGRDNAGQWWYIKNPSKPGQFCWVWTETTSVTGSTTQLPVVTPPPPPPTATPTPTESAGFTLSYITVHACGGQPTAIFQVTNNGGFTLESLNLKIEDVTASTTLFGPSSSDAPFMGASGECPPGGDKLPVGKTLYIGGAIGPGNSGHTGRATVKLCTENGLGGACVEKKVDFTIP